MNFPSLKMEFELNKCEGISSNLIVLVKISDGTDDDVPLPFSVSPSLSPLLCSRTIFEVLQEHKKSESTTITSKMITE